MVEILVSICIPTYNRAEYLSKSLESIVVQKEFLDGKVEVIISDNASTDSTQEVGMEYSSKYPNVLYFKNEKNVQDANFPLALSRANGRLLKLCNDTLLYKKNALKIFCDTAEKYWRADRKSRPLIFFANGNISLKEASPLLDFEAFLVRASYCITWIGGFSFWKEDFEKLGQDVESAKTHLWQVKQICRNLESINEAVVVSERFCVNQSVKGKNISYGLYKVFYENYLGILKPYCDKGCFSQECYEFLRKDLLLNFFPGWIANWEIQNKSFVYSDEENLKKKIIETYKNEPYFDEFKRKYSKALIRAKLQRIKAHIKNFLKIQ